MKPIIFLLTSLILGAAGLAGGLVYAQSDSERSLLAPVFYDEPEDILRDKALIQRERGQALGLTEQLAEAEANVRLALHKTQQKLGTMHPAVAKDLRFLATLYRARDKHAEAEALIRWALEIQELASGPFHPDVASNLIFLADLCFDTHRLQEAEVFYGQALTIREQLLGADHPGVAEGLDHYAILLRKIGKMREAETMEARARAIRADHAMFLE